MFTGDASSSHYKVKHQTHPRSKDVQITRLRFGHVIQLRDKLYVIGQRTDPNCPTLATCNQPEDVEYYLMECPSQQQLQDQLKARCTAAKRNFTLKNVLAMETCLDTVFDFIKKQQKFL